MTSQSAERIGGWLLAPLALVAGGAAERLVIAAVFANALMSPQTYTLLRAMSAGHMALWVASLLFALAMWYYTLWLTIAFFKRRSVVPKHYYYLAAHHPAAGDKGFCLLAGLGCACPASAAAVSAAGRCAAGALFSPFAAGKTDFC